MIDFSHATLVGRGRSIAVRARNRVARELLTRFGRFEPAVLGYGVDVMLKTALAEKADLTIVHSEAGLWVGGQLLDKGLHVGVDFEDWFSEDLLPEARRSRPLTQLKSLERRLMRECRYRLTTSHALAGALSEAYGETKPAVVYNTFPFAERASVDGKVRDRIDKALPSLHWFSQTIGPGRGLETLFRSLQYLSFPAEIHLRGNCPAETERWIKSSVSDEWAERVFIHPTVSNAELLSRISEHDIGLALETPNCPSRNMTITNKLFQYMQAGLAVIATDTLGQQEVMQKCPGAGRLVTSDDPQSLARAISSLAKDGEKLFEAKKASEGAARDMFSWEVQAEVLLDEAERALSSSALNSLKVVRPS
jgi:glycosyltransferase involved in cell wall biosynthesis